VADVDRWLPAVSFTGHWLGVVALIAFLGAYALAMAEERLHVRKSVPVLIAAGLIWVLVGIGSAGVGQSTAVGELARHTLLDFAELLLFLIPAMTFVNTLEERGLFDVLRARLTSSGLSLRSVFWVTGALAFVVSPVADNLTTALLLGTVAMAVGRSHPRFVPLACINIVVAANAGGAFSPFGDITTLMVWQAGRVPFADFFGLVLPSLVNWLVPAVLLSLAISSRPAVSEDTDANLEPGALPVLGLFVVTIVLTVVLHTFLELPPAVGMMAGLGLLKGYSYVFNYRHPPSLIDELDDVFAEPQLEPESGTDRATRAQEGEPGYAPTSSIGPSAPGAAVLAAPVVVGAALVAPRPAARPLDIFALLEKIEWDTLLFFYGVLMGVGGLGALGYLALTSQVLYGHLGATPANMLVGILSALVDNVPVMFAVLQMDPDMSRGQWLLVTLTTGVGGSLLSIGSAAGVALMGQARGVYTFGAHLRWTWAVALGFLASVGVHLVMQEVLHVWG
jgi:Na+/H+ antiporter NhaD/arsenite permease-like protein